MVRAAIDKETNDLQARLFVTRDLEGHVRCIEAKRSKSGLILGPFRKIEEAFTKDEFTNTTIVGTRKCTV